MEKQLIHLFDTLNVNETNQLLEKDIDFKVETQTLSRIKAITSQKIQGKKKQFLWARFKNLRAAAVAVFVFTAAGGVTGYAYYKAPTAYLDIDINPSIELGINRWDRVVSAKGYNNDGENVLKAKNVLNKKADEVVRFIMETANDQGFLDLEGGATVAVTSITDDADKAKTLTDVSKEAIEQYTQEETLDVEVVVEHIALKRLEEAKQLGITPGKLNLIQKLQVLDDAITVQDYKEATVKEIMKTAIALKKEQKLNQKQEKVENLEEPDEEETEESLEINEDNSDRKLDVKIENGKRNAKVIEQENKINLDSGNKRISPQDTKQDTKQDNEQDNKPDNGIDNKADDKADDKLDNKPNDKLDSKKDNNQEIEQDNGEMIEQKNNQSDKQNTGQEKMDSTKKVKK